ncbi:hypothetical protein EMCRGX_G009594 [Ephydatia muelleri]
MELKELGFIQAIIASITLYAKLVTSPLIEHTIPSNSNSNQSDGPIINATCSGAQASHHNFVLGFCVVGWVLSIPVFTYAQMLHPGIPTLTHPIKQKKGLHWFMAAIFGTTLFCYITLGIVVSLWFRGDINETASLNWRDLFDEYEEKASRIVDETQYSDELNRVRKRKRHDDDSGAEEVVLFGKDKCRIETYLPILNSLSAELNRRVQAYDKIELLFGFLVEFPSKSDDELRLATETFRENYDVDIDFQEEMVHFKYFAAQLEHRGDTIPVSEA